MLDTVRILKGNVCKLLSLAEYIFIKLVSGKNEQYLVVPDVIRLSLGLKR